ncbi:hypothetical protein B0H63DRAFT_476569 [Podospora didyma]|uniref:Rhodopsin domain-containing protein n=1 Tax=Podospora didyma TaxID=330526 RepID=A0AAE0TW59_9PEZI|nr:hypothetical protein B0H63DRAFT_476569 [Podospora didyma]
MGGQTLVSLFGVADNYGEPIPAWNRKENVLAIIIIFMSLSWVCALGRLYVRLFIIFSPGWDDVFLVLYLLSTTAGSVFICLLTEWGLGEHFLKLSIPTMQGYLFRFYIGNATYAMSTSLIKISLLFQYLRVIEKGTWLRKLCVGSIVVIFLWGLAYSFMAWVPCIPINSFWDFSVPHQQCFGYGSLTALEFNATYESHTATNMLFDLLVFCIPIPLYFKSETAFKTKMSLLALFTMGGLVVGCSAWRLSTIIEHQAATYPTFDPSWYGPVSMILAAIEVDLASICASVPVFWPVLLRMTALKIFVMEEVEVKHEDRGADMQFELNYRGWRARSGSGETQSGGEYTKNEEGERPSKQHSPHGSEVFFLTSALGTDELKPDLPAVCKKTSATTLHYQDDYIIKQVSPFRSNSMSGDDNMVDRWSAVEAQAKIDTASRRKQGLRRLFSG